MSSAIEEIRKAIDAIDTQLVELLAERKDLVLSIAEEKKKEDLPKFDYEREAELIQKRRAHAKKLGLDEEVVERLFKVVLEYSKEFLDKEPSDNRSDEPKESDKEETVKKE